ncbi:DUF4389 domain-containing protein [Methylophaga sp. OBS1]|jgi:hypothetical protein|uniref:DUF4389 domain-containing protein n=1 Tax=Methylophaga sp. OBS1 TaxID=2991933 RepID=UPI0022503A59|nr:DUF4389 domain-containing protein [Methylophaga sp. OBS1]MCX4192838.1 DUF4389 domain-containing protein [Methylophaga sp. OBS1]
MDNETVKKNVSNKNQWLRILYMLLFAVILYLVMMLVTVVVIVQLLFALFTGKPNDDIGDFADDLSKYVYRIVAFLTYTDDRRPFPFDNWEQEDDSAEDDDDDYSQSVENMGDTGQPGGDKRSDPNQK